MDNTILFYSVSIFSNISFFFLSLKSILTNFAFGFPIQALTRHGLGDGREGYCLCDPLVQGNAFNKE